MKTKYIVVTGGVLSGIGKGVATASIGNLLCKNYKIVTVKCDGYLNIDPGTMNPIEHGEVFVLDDGAEVDMDFGHYERFIGVNCKNEWNLTSGKIFSEVFEKERRGDYLGRTVQVIPHITEHIKSKIKGIAEKEKAEVMLIEIGGTVGDIESSWFVEAVRQMKYEKGMEMINVHLTFIPYLHTVEEQKTKPAQNDIALLREKGINPDIVIGRCEQELTEKSKNKLAVMSNLDIRQIIGGRDVASVYEVPLIFEGEGILEILHEKLFSEENKEEFMKKAKNHFEKWQALVKNILQPKRKVKIAICGKYTGLKDSYASVIEALRHAGANLDAGIEIKWIETTEIEEGRISIEEALNEVKGVIVPGGFGSRGVEGKIEVIKYARENDIPYLGLCYGMQLAVVEFARNVCEFDDANSTEIDEMTKFPVVFLMPSQRDIIKKGATMRLGGKDVLIKNGTYAENIFKTNGIRRRFRHRYEINPEYIKEIEHKGMIFSGMAKNEEIMQIIELPNHRFFMASQFHPELTSRLDKPDEMFYNFIKESLY
ncbi:CTP synthase (glutamine hydrolyzing) [Candidatus Woesearchaeota archaeon]|nr:CTP synthase (glutamine hydrolyzing) [Candidatus Woesearchaeota archaeon]